MSYLVLARKDRPKTFTEVVEQAHVTTTLENAVRNDRVAHAVLFSGPRGTGKTTIARILAKAMNCAEGPTPAPCGECTHCREITAGGAADVIEIDGASNNSVDNIRDLRENVKYMPAKSRFKIYIIDEVHMLSASAFNALLKTLEEPPGHVIFLFATTEPHKIPVTILSRCQRHELRRISVNAVTRRLQILCENEGVSLEPEILDAVARAAGGSMRDALSLLDQVMTAAAGALSREELLDVLGVVDREALFAISKAVFSGDVPALLDQFDRLYERGRSIKELHAVLVEHFRNLRVVRIGKGSARVIDAPDHEIERMRKQTTGVSEMFLTRILDALFQEEPAIRYSARPKAALEMLFIKLLDTTPTLSIDELIQKIDALKTALDTGDYNHEAGGLDEPGKIGTAPLTQPAAVEANLPGGPAGVPLPDEPGDDAANADLGGKSGAATARRAPDTAAGEYAASAENNQGIPDVAAASDGGGEGPRTPPPVEKSRADLVPRLQKRFPAMAGLFGTCRLKTLTGDVLSLEVCAKPIVMRMLREDRYRDVKAFCEDYFGHPLKLEITEVTPDTPENGPAAAPETPAARGRSLEQKKNDALNHPLVTAAVRLFNGRVERVEVRNPSD